VVRARDILEDETRFFARRLDFDFSVSEDRVDESADFARYVLHVVEHKLARRSAEEPLLFNVDDALIRDDPHVEVPVDEILEEEEPRVEEEDARAEDEEGELLGDGEEFGRSELNGGIDAEGENEREEESERERERGQPMAAEEEDRPFVLRVAEEAAKGDHGSVVCCFAYLMIVCRKPDRRIGE